MDLLWLLAGLYLLIGLLQLGLVVENLRLFQAAPPGVDANQASHPPVAVLIPARNEATRIEACLDGLSQQTGVEMGVWVLDDQSEDDTFAIALQAARRDQRIQVIRGLTEPPPGWNGKSYACQRLADLSEGAWLCFVDADVTLRPDALEQALAIATRKNADLLSFWPRQTMLSSGERLMMPLLSFVLLAHLPLRLVLQSPDARFSAANGQCLLVRRERYVQAGGHAAIRQDMVDDLALARLIKQAGGRLLIRDAGELANCRMYDGFQALWAGFRKNLYPAFGGQPAAFLLGTGILGLWHVLPLPLLLLGLSFRLDALALCGGAQLGIGLLIRALLATRLGHPWPSVVAHPLAAACLVTLAFDSWRGWWLGGVKWKGRLYDKGGNKPC